MSLAGSTRIAIRRTVSQFIASRRLGNSSIIIIDLAHGEALDQNKLHLPKSAHIANARHILDSDNKSHRPVQASLPKTGERKVSLRSASTRRGDYHPQKKLIHYS